MTSLRGHSHAATYWRCWVPDLSPTGIIPSAALWIPMVGMVQHRSRALPVSTDQCGLPVCIVGVLGGCFRRPALSGGPGFRSICVSLFHVKNPVQRTRNYQRRGSLPGAFAVQTFTKVTKRFKLSLFCPQRKKNFMWKTTFFTFPC